MTSAGLITDAFGRIRETVTDTLYGLTAEQVTYRADADLDRVVDTSWRPPVTLGVRLVSVLNDDAQHAGQAAFVRGVVLRAS